MGADQSNDQFEDVVEVKAQKLFEIVKAILDVEADMQAEILEKFGGVTVTLGKGDAEAIKAIVSGAQSPIRSSARERLAAAVPNDFGHCTIRRRR
jgi:hypothetical protein